MSSPPSFGTAGHRNAAEYGGHETARRKEGPIRVDLLRAGDPAWDDWLSDVPRDVYHTAGYHAYAQGSGEGEPYLIVVGDRQHGFAWPYLLRQVSEVENLADSGATDVTSVYGYSGPLAWGCTPGDPLLAAAWSEVLAVWRRQGAVSAFTRFHPLLGNESLLSALPWPRDSAVEPEPVVALGRTVSIDLSVSEEVARAGYSESLRRQIRNFRQAGLTTTHDEDWTDLAAFAHLYRETMARNAAVDYYFFDAADFDRLHTALSGHVHLLVTRMDEVVGAAGLFTEYEGIVQEHLVATNQALAPVSPYKVLIDDAYTWARKRGNTVFHLGGGRGAYEDSLFEFKRRFSPRRHLFFTGRWILDRPACRDLLEARLSAARGEGLLDPDYFPAYRAPVVGPDRLRIGPKSGSTHRSDPGAAPSVSPERSAAFRHPLTGDGQRRQPAIVNPGPTIGKPVPVEASVEFRVVSPHEAEALAELFEDIDETFFRPHPFTADEARSIANLQGRDAYVLLLDHGRPVAYGMLRGWNEGFEIPSLGIAVRTDSHRRGFGRLMMAHLHEVARAHGAETVRLRVHPDNHRARRLYESLGYQYAGEDRGELVMVTDVRPASDEPIGDRPSVSTEWPGDRRSR